jgi:4-amino-4-deoxy-L-arabinose transferase-like glycosyltransferase
MPPIAPSATVPVTPPMSPPMTPRASRGERVRDLLLIALVCAVFFGWRLGRLPLIDPDEPFYALTAREMLDAKDWVVPRIFGHPQFEKPAMVYWLMMSSMTAFGRTEAAERLPMALSATALVFAVYAFGRRQFGRRAALASAVVLATGVQFMTTSRLVLTDMIFALFTTLSCFAFWIGSSDGARRRRWWIGAMLCSGLAVITKGPLGLLVPGLAATVALIRGMAPRRIDGVTLAVGLAVFAAVALPWYAVMTQRFGPGFLQTFLMHENWERLVRAEHRENDRWYYYLAVLTVGSLPWWPSLAATVTRFRAESRRDPTVAFLWGWILSSVAFFQLAHSKLPTYVLFAFVPLALLAGRTIMDPDGPLTRSVRVASRGAGVLQVLVFCAAAFVPLLAPVRMALLLAAVLLAVGVGLLWRDRWAAWATSTALASAVLLVALLTTGAPWIESMTSTRAPAAAVAAALAPGEPLVCERFMVRGLTYYSGLTPTVLSRNPRPYFSPHPLRVIVGPEGLTAFVREHGRALCLVETRAWPTFAAGVPAGWSVTPLLQGERSLFRIAARGTSPEH